MAVMISAAKQHPRVLAEPQPSVVIKGFGESGIDLGLNVWIEIVPEEGTSQLQSDIYLQLWREFQQHGIEIPFPQREIRVLGEAIAQTNAGKPV